MVNPIRDLVKFLEEILKRLNSLNEAQRNEIRAAVGKLGIELDRSLLLAEIYLTGAENITNKAKLSTYLRKSRSELLQTYNTFQVCDGLYEISQKLAAAFPAKGKNAADVIVVKDLLQELESKERLVVDDIQSIFSDLDAVARKLDLARSAANEKQAREEAMQLIAGSTQVIETKRKAIADVVKRITETAEQKSVQELATAE
jgi:hypothetical protein